MAVREGGPLPAGFPTNDGDLFAVLFRALPEAALEYVWRGASLATFLWFFATLGFAWYVRHLASYNVMYGSIGAGIALLVWMYMIALIALIGCEFNATHERTMG